MSPLPMSEINAFPHLAVHVSPVWLVVSNSPGVSGSFLSTSGNLFVFWLVGSGPRNVSNSFVSPPSNHLSSNLAGCVRLSRCLHFICLPVWGARCLQNLFSHLVFHWFPTVAGGVRLSRCLPFVCLRILPIYSNWFVFQSRWCCPDLPASPAHWSPHLNSCVSQSGWWCRALPMSWAHVSPGGARLSRCLQFIASLSIQCTCLPIWLVVSCPRVPLFTYLLWFVSQPGWCPGSWCFPSLVSLHLSPSGWWFPALPVHLSPCMCLPVWLVIPGSSSDVSPPLSPPDSSSSPDLSLSLSPLMCLLPAWLLVLPSGSASGFPDVSLRLPQWPPVLPPKGVQRRKKMH